MTCNTVAVNVFLFVGDDSAADIAQVLMRRRRHLTRLYSAWQLIPDIATGRRYSSRN